MIDLNNYISITNIKEQIGKTYKNISNINEANIFIKDVLSNNIYNVKFSRSSLKNYCFEHIQKYMDINIINCNSCMERFCEDYIKEAQVNIYNNIKSCKSEDILNLIYNSKGIFVD